MATPAEIKRQKAEAALVVSTTKKTEADRVSAEISKKWRADIDRCVAAGVPHARAAALAGIGRSTMYSFVPKKKGRK